MFTDSWGRAFALNLAYFCVKDLGVAVENPLKWRISEFESVRSFLQLNSQDEPFALTWQAERHYVTMFNWAAHLGLSSVLQDPGHAGHVPPGHFRRMGLWSMEDQ